MKRPSAIAAFANCAAISATVLLAGCGSGLGTWMSSSQAAADLEDDARCRDLGYAVDAPDYRQCRKDAMAERLATERTQDPPHYVPQR